MAPVILLHMRNRVSGLTGTETLRKETFPPSFLTSLPITETYSDCIWYLVQPFFEHTLSGI